MTQPSDRADALSFAGRGFDDLCRALAELSIRPDAEDVWPAAQLERLADAGVLGWVIPAQFGGSEIPGADLIAGYEFLARTDLLTTFVLTQRNGACQRIVGSTNEDLKAELLPKLCTGELFATVGISHLTTSRQHLQRPAVEVLETADGYVLHGAVPWVTGARYADFLVTGGTLSDGRQLLAAVPARGAGVVAEPPPRLLALNGSQTASVRLEHVPTDRRLLIAGPAEQIMKRGKGGGAGSLTTSALAVGAAANTTGRLISESLERPDVAEVAQALDGELRQLSIDLRAAASGESGETAQPGNVEAIRTRANSLVLRAAQSYLAASKGAGFVAGHPAERAVRESLFFLVWSCPQPVLQATLREFACVIE